MEQNHERLTSTGGATTRLWLTDDERYELARENNRRLREQANPDLTDTDWYDIFTQTVSVSDSYNIVIN